MKKLVSILFVTISLSTISGQQINTKAEIPNTPAGKQLSNWLHVFAGGNQDSFTVFIAERYSKNLLEQDKAYDHADRQARKYTDARSYDIRAIEKSSDSKIVVLAQASLTGLWFRITMKVESVKPYLITEYTSQRISPPSGTQKKLDEEELVKEIKIFMDNLVAADAFSGTVLIAKNDKTIFSGAYGLASKAYNIPNRIDTKLSIASIGKIFTAIAILQLVEQGKLSLTDTIGKFLPDYPNKQVSGKVTIHHLLTHSSGLSDIHGTEYACKKIALRKVNDFLPLFNKDSLKFEPGDHMEYSNAGYVLLGAIIEKVSGEDYFDYINKHIFEPAGMINTGFYEADIDVPNRATGYTNYLDIGNDYQEFHLGQWRNTSLYNGANASPSGGAGSTVEDLLRFTQAFKSGKLVNAETIKLMTTNKIFFRKYDASEDFMSFSASISLTNCITEGCAYPNSDTNSVRLRGDFSFNIISTAYHLFIKLALYFLYINPASLLNVSVMRCSRTDRERILWSFVFINLNDR